jgi:hypothetical protein
MVRRQFLLLLFAPWLCAQTADEIVRKSLAVDQRDWQAAQAYTYQEDIVTRERDAKGGVKKTERMTYDVAYYYGSPYRRLIRKDGQPLSAKEEQRVREEMEKELAKRRKDPEREQREYEKSRREMRKMLDQIPRAFRFTLVRNESVSSLPCWVLDAEPRPDFKGEGIRAKSLSKMRGRLWISQSDYRWVKADVEVIDTLSFGWLLFRLSPGSRMAFEAARVNSEIWMPSRLRVSADGRLAMLKKLRTDIDIDWSNYRKFQIESRIVSTDLQP